MSYQDAEKNKRLHETIESLEKLRVEDWCDDCHKYHTGECERMSEGKQEARDVKDLSAKDVAAHIRYWWGNGHFDLVKTLEAWKPARQANQPQPIARPNVVGASPVCLDCNAAGIQNCSHFDNCAGRWVYKPDHPQGKAQPDSGEMGHWSDYRCPHCGLALTNEWINKVQRGAFQRGQQAMAEKAAQKCEEWANMSAGGDGRYGEGYRNLANSIRSLASAEPTLEYKRDQEMYQRGRRDAGEELAQWCEQQTGDFTRFFTPESVAKVIRSLTGAAPPQGEGTCLYCQELAEIGLHRSDCPARNRDAFKPQGEAEK